MNRPQPGGCVIGGVPPVIAIAAGDIVPVFTNQLIATVIGEFRIGGRCRNGPSG
ncbi:MAG: hypothetical protein JXR76_03685 [Deltaproteobacteria bacterium]|nr:hypothetical protein [Deltaproteobacteria bacterium]